MTTHITRMQVTVALDPLGLHRGTSVHEAFTLDGKLYEKDAPRSIQADDAAGLAAVMSQVQAAALVTIDAQTAQITAHEATIQTLTSERNAAREERDALQAQIAAAAAPTDSNGVPVRVPMAAGRIALSRAGKLAAIKAALAAMPGQAGEEAREWFEYSSHIERAHPTVQAMTPLIGTSADVDALFIAAAQIAAGTA